MATIYEVSERADVSLATVSRVINNSGRVAEKTRQKVLDAMAALDYRPNSIAQSLASNRSNSVGVLVPELHGPFFGVLVSGIEAELRDSGKHVIITVGHSDRARERDGVEFLAGRKCDALILHVDALSDDEIVELCAGPIPIVIMNRFVAGASRHCISIDNQLGGYLATKHVLELGHRDLAYIAGPLWKLDASERFVGHKRALAEFGIDFREELMVEGDFRESSGGESMRRLLDSKLPFSAVVCANDSMAAGAMKVARESGLVLPGALSIVGFDNVIIAPYLYPQLSTIDYPVDEMGHMAARWVFKHVYGRESLEIQHVFEPSLVVRESVVARESPAPRTPARGLHGR